MKHYVWEPNLGLIENIKILKDHIQFLPSQFIQIRGKITRKSNIWGQLKKFETKTYFAKGAEQQGLN